MIKTDWLFFNKDGSYVKETFEEDKLPNIGDGKHYKGKGYAITLIGENMLTNPNTLIIAKEH